MSARAAVAALSVALIACADPADPEPENEAATQAGEAEPLPRYVGMWATTADGCADPAWRFESDRISTRGEVYCEFREVRTTPMGYDLDAVCFAEAPPVASNIQISFAESARTMTLTGGPWDPAPALIYCRGL